MKRFIAILAIVGSLFVMASCKPNKPDETETYHYQPSITFDESGLTTELETES